MEDVTCISWMRGTHKFHENWVTINRIGRNLVLRYNIIALWQVACKRLSAKLFNRESFGQIVPLLRKNFHLNAMGKVCLAPGDTDCRGAWVVWVKHIIILVIFSLFIKTYTCKSYINSEQNMEKLFLIIRVLQLFNIWSCTLIILKCFSPK